MTTKLRFVSRNPHKVAEVKTILQKAGILIVPVDFAVEEIQTDDSNRLIRHKAVAAYDRLRLPLIVEHTGLHLESLEGLPGGLTQVFWDHLKADRFAELFGRRLNPRATARTQIAYVDGTTISIFSGAIDGRIARVPRGPRGFQWDCIFIPKGHPRTFAEMSQRQKNKISMRRQALDKLVNHIQRRASDGSAT